MLLRNNLQKKNNSWNNYNEYFSFFESLWLENNLKRNKFNAHNEVILFLQLMKKLPAELQDIILKICFRRSNFQKRLDK